MSVENILQSVASFAVEEDAATAVEYAIMLAFIIGVCMASVTFLAESTHDSFETSGDAINNAIGN